MDPLSVIASVLAISEAFGLGVKTLKGLANASSEFNDMLGELSALQAWLDQLRLATESLATTEFQISGNLLGRLELAKVELSQIVNGVEEIRRKLIKNGKDKEVELNKKAGAKISVITWPWMRGRIQKLRDRAKRCREELSACLDVFGLMQQLQQQQTSREILNISNTQYLLMQATFARYEERFSALEATKTRQDQAPGFTDSPSSMEPADTISRGQLTRTDEKPWVTDIQVPVRQKCSRYCKCQCHRSSVIRNPSWSHALIGSMMIQYNGTVRLDTSPCDMPGCRSAKGRKIRVAYSFPSWLIRRAFQLSASWDSLTDMGSSLHLTVPRVSKPPMIFTALRSDDTQWLRDTIEKRLLMPTDITEDGEPYLLYAFRRGSAQCVRLLLQAGFRSSFPDQRSGMSPAASARRQLLLGKHSVANMNCGRLIIESLAVSEQTEDPGVSTLVRDAILQVGSMTLEDALALEGSNINNLDDVGFTPLHWAAAGGTPSQIGLLLRHGADMNIQDAYHNRTPLLTAVQTANAPGVEFLISEGSNIESRDLDGLGALHLCESPDVMQILLNRVQDTRFLNTKCSGGNTALHHAVLKCAAGELIAMLRRAGAYLEATNQRGSTPLLTAVSVDSVQATEKLHSLGARLESVGNSGRGILHRTAIRGNLGMMSLLRSLAIEGINPGHEDVNGLSAVDYFKERMVEPWQPGQTRPTQRDAFCFYALITEIRDRNWERGLFLETRERLESEGQLKDIRRWLGRQWQKLHDDEEFGDLIWDIEHDYYPEEYYEEEIDVDYDVGILFGDNDQLLGHFEGEITPISPQGEEEGDLDEFFDALE